MKSNFLTFFLVAAIAAVSFAQGPKMARSNAIASLSDYRLDKKRNFKSLDEAKTNIDIAAKDAEMGADPKTWQYFGDIYLELQMDLVLSKKYTQLSGPMADAYIKMMQLDAKKKFKLEAENGTINAVGMLYNDGGTYYNGADRVKAAELFEKAALIVETFITYTGKITEADVDQKLKDAYPTADGKAAITMTDIRYQAGISNLLAGKVDAAEKLLLPLVDKPGISDDRKAEIYLEFFNVFKATDNAKAKNYLATGRQKFPKNQSLLVTEIQLAFDEGRSGELVQQVQQAVSNDPTNVSLRHALGSIYDELLRKAGEKKDLVAARDYFDKAKAEYLQIISMKPDYTDAYYNLAVLYNNAAAELSKQLEEVPMKEYEAKEKELKPQIDANIKQALDYFDKGAKVLEAKGDKQNLLAVWRAMLEIYAKIDEEKYMELNKKVKALEGQ